MSGLEILFCTSVLIWISSLHCMEQWDWQNFPTSFFFTDGNGQSLWPSSLWRGVRANRFWDCRFEYRREYGRRSLVSVVYCQGEVSATGRSQESYRVWWVWVWSWRVGNKKALAHEGLLVHGKIRGRYLKSRLLYNLSQYLTNMMHKICFTISFIWCLYMFRAHVLIIRIPEAV